LGVGGQPMRQITTIGLIIFLFGSCDKEADFKSDYVKRIDSADKIEFVWIIGGQKTSTIVADKDGLNYVRDIIKPGDLFERKLTDNVNFPVDIILYKDDKVVGQLGIEFGHIQYLYYKGDKDFEYKAEMNYRLGMYIQDL
jgi:hypothetical protein